MGNTMKRGQRFLHSKWYSSRFSLEEIKTKPREETAQECIVTTVRKGNIYYRPVYKHSDREDLGSPMYISLETFDQYCMKVL